MRTTKEKGYFYILTNKGKNVLYTGLTKNLINRVKEHRKGYQKGFTKKYNVNRLVYCEVFEHIDMAKDREKQIKGWKRQRKMRGRKHPDPSSIFYSTIQPFDKGSIIGGQIFSLDK